MTATTEQTRTRLLKMIRGGMSAVQLHRVGYMIVATEAEHMTAQTAGTITMPTEYGALQSVCDAIGAADMLATWRHYGEDAADEDIAEAMQQYVCLVNYGGTLRAENLNAPVREAAVILKDMTL